MLVPFFIGVVGIVAFFVWEVRLAPYPMVPKKLFSKDKKTMILILFITFISGANFFAVLLIWPTQNYQVYGTSTRHFALSNRQATTRLPLVSGRSPSESASFSALSSCLSSSRSPRAASSFS